MAMLTAVLTAQAQGWDVRHEPADDLKGTPERIRYRLEVGGTKVFAFYDTGDFWKVGVGGNGFKPDPTHLNGNQNFVTYARIGFYDGDGRLVESYDGCELEVVDMYRVAQVNENGRRKDNGAYKVAEYLRTQTGYVRLLIPTHFGDGFDLRIPCLGNE